VSDLSQHLAASQRIEIEDLDWAACKAHGLTDREIECLKFFADIESQTVYYFLEIAKLQAVRDPGFLTFLTMWNYEEYFHSHAITRVLVECGVPVESATERSTRIRGTRRFRTWLEDTSQTLMSKLFPRRFIGLWCFWGSMQECLTTQAYEEVMRATQNPVLAELMRRIAKQERRHFAYYYNEARERLLDPGTQRLCRFIAKNFYAPVGAGVKSAEQAAQLVATLFPGDRIFEVMGYIEKRVSTLPGMEGLDVCTRWARRIQPILPESMRAAASAAA